MTSEMDKNPYFLFISPWKKYKRHYEIEKRKLYFHENTFYFNSLDDSLNKEHFIYKLNTLA